MEERDVVGKLLERAESLEESPNLTPETAREAIQCIFDAMGLTWSTLADEAREQPLDAFAPNEIVPLMAQMLLATKTVCKRVCRIALKAWEQQQENAHETTH